MTCVNINLTWFYFILFFHFLSTPMMLQTIHWRYKRYKAFDHFQPFLYTLEFKDTYLFFKNHVWNLFVNLSMFSVFLFSLQCLQWKCITFLHLQQCMFYVISFFLEDRKCFLSTKRKTTRQKTQEEKEKDCDILSQFFWN